MTRRAARTSVEGRYGPPATGRTATGRTATGRTATGRTATGQAATGQAATGQAGTGSGIGYGRSSCMMTSTCTDAGTAKLAS